MSYYGSQPQAQGYGAPSSGGPPGAPQVPPGWQALWNDQYKTW